MPYDEALAERILDLLADERDVTTRKMFGGLCVLWRGHMLAGVVRDDLMARVGPDAYAEALAAPHAREMDFTKRPMKGMVYVAPDGLLEDADLEAWVERCKAFVGTLPPK